MSEQEVRITAEQLDDIAAAIRNLVLEGDYDRVWNELADDEKLKYWKAARLAVLMAGNFYRQTQGELS